MYFFPLKWGKEEKSGEEFGTICVCFLKVMHVIHLFSHECLFGASQCYNLINKTWEFSAPKESLVYNGGLETKMMEWDKWIM